MMTDNNLSQEEIETLMGDMKQTDNAADLLTPEEKDALGEIGNISFGSSATALSELLGNKTEIDTPTVSATTLDQLENEFEDPYVSVKVNYIEGIIGENMLIIDMKDAAVIANLMMGGDGTDVNADSVGEMELSAVQEAMNQMMGKSATSMSMIFKKTVDISPPETQILDMRNGEAKKHIPNQEPLVRVSFRLTVGDLIDSEVMMLFKLDFAKELVEHLLNNQEEVPPQEPSQPEPTPNVKEEAKPVQNKIVNQPPTSLQGSPEVQTASFSDFAPAISEGSGKNIDLLYDIDLPVSVELGRTKRSVKEILEFSSGSIIELDRLAGEHVDILVNDTLIAKGEVVVIEENFGVRVTDILSPKDVMQKIR
ncbi:flagellar motor switch phosphatase FliY (plasmid) [Rossellomorea sp. AcN35-11]|nr:flagellar motor switch phosphatase FliY [Rossellomorea aquimaris]WJV32289.1 flagellar motor switch phosphatase FliY [Rossellomorea sp. AcN35-11]